MSEFNGTPHNTAKVGDFAKTVLMPGDPLRAKYVAENFLEDVKQVNGVRGMLGFTGTYKGVPVSVMGSGMGMPSIGIYSYELYNFYGVENIIRIGSAGSPLPVMSVIVANKAYSKSSFAKVGFGYEEEFQLPSEKLSASLVKAAEELGKNVYVGPIHSSDVFYSDPNATDATAQDGFAEETLGVEMESFALFNNANMLGKNATCMLTISDSFVTSEEIPAEDRQKSFTEMMKLALETAIAL